jgi:hypothetical protein
MGDEAVTAKRHLVILDVNGMLVHRWRPVGGERQPQQEPDATTSRYPTFPTYLGGYKQIYTNQSYAKRWSSVRSKAALEDRPRWGHPAVPAHLPQHNIVNNIFRQGIISHFADNKKMHAAGGTSSPCDLILVQHRGQLLYNRPYMREAVELLCKSFSVLVSAARSTGRTKTQTRERYFLALCHSSLAEGISKELLSDVVGRLGGGRVAVKSAGSRVSTSLWCAGRKGEMF